MKIHGIASLGGAWGAWGGTRGTTLCGREFWTTTVKGEVETIDNVRLDVAPMNDMRTVDCKRCLAAIANMPKGDASGIARYL